MCPLLRTVSKGNLVKSSVKERMKDVKEEVAGVVMGSM